MSATTTPSPPPEVETPTQQSLIQWEEWALSTEEHFHAIELHRKNPNGKPMGHR